jgi:hypothetical protein
VSVDVLHQCQAIRVADGHELKGLSGAQRAHPARHDAHGTVLIPDEQLDACRGVGIDAIGPEVLEDDAGSGELDGAAVRGSDAVVGQRPETGSARGRPRFCREFRTYMWGGHRRGGGCSPCARSACGRAR